MISPNVTTFLSIFPDLDFFVQSIAKLEIYFNYTNSNTKHEHRRPEELHSSEFPAISVCTGKILYLFFIETGTTFFNHESYCSGS
jgi:hypothetical protein